MSILAKKITVDDSESAVTINSTSAVDIILSFSATDTFRVSGVALGTEGSDFYSGTSERLPLVISQAEAKLGFTFYVRGVATGGDIHILATGKDSITCTVV